MAMQRVTSQFITAKSRFESWVPDKKFNQELHERLKWLVLETSASTQVVLAEGSIPSLLTIKKITSSVEVRVFQLALEARERRFKSCLLDKMVLGAAWSGRLPVTQHNQAGSNPVRTATQIRERFVLRQ